MNILIEFHWNASQKEIKKFAKKWNLSYPTDTLGNIIKSYLIFKICGDSLEFCETKFTLDILEDLIDTFGCYLALQIRKPGPNNLFTEHNKIDYIIEIVHKELD